MTEEIDVNKTNESRRCINCNYYYFLKVNFRFQPKACDGCHDLMQKEKASDCRIHFWHKSKYEAINIMKKFYLNKKIGLVKKYQQKKSSVYKR